jgi:nucleoside phosphorylase
MLLLVFALPEEARMVRKKIRDSGNGHADRNGVLGSRGKLAGQEVALCFVGIGAGRIAKLEESMELIKPRLVISSGFAGATRSLLEAGDFVLATNYTDAEMVAALRQQNIFDAAGAFAQVQQVASASDKWSLNHSRDALAVDMESETIADLCCRRGLPLITARMISDGIDEVIPAIFSRGKFSGFNDLGHAAVFAARMLRLTGKLADRLETLAEESSTF